MPTNKPRRKRVKAHSRDGNKVGTYLRNPRPSGLKYKKSKKLKGRK